MARVPRTAARRPAGPPAHGHHRGQARPGSGTCPAAPGQPPQRFVQGRVGVVAMASYTARSTAAAWWTASRVVTRVC